MARKLLSDTSYPGATKASYSRAEDVVTTQSTQDRGPSNTGDLPYRICPVNSWPGGSRPALCLVDPNSNSFCRSAILPPLFFS